jgi:hypothetical protein
MEGVRGDLADFKMKREEYISRISNALASLTNEVKIRNSINLFDINIHAEDFFKELLNLIFDYRLENLNIVDGKSATAIDLCDKNRKIAIQVTSETRSSKVHDTLKKFLEKNLYKEFDRLLFLIISVDDKEYKATFDSGNLLDFDKNRDILFLTDLLREIRKHESQRIQEIANFVELELGKGVTKVSESNEVETIIRLIDYLSNNRKVVNPSEEETEPDPDRKIYKRFSDHAEFLTNSYKDLASVYTHAVNEAKKVLGLDGAMVLIIGDFLKDTSDKYLTKWGGNPKAALEDLTGYFAKKIGTAGINYDSRAIKFYLISQIIGCNVFPNEKGE